LAKRLSIVISDETYQQLISLKNSNEIQSTTDHIRASIQLYLWYHEQIKLGFTVVAEKEQGSEKIKRELLLR
jgi:predicted CopG family antitoxin